KSFRSFPDRIPAATKRLRDQKGGPLRTPLLTEPGIEVELLWDVKNKVKDKKTGILLVLNPGDEYRLREVPLWLRPFTDGAAVHVLAPRGTADRPWTHKSPPNYV